MSKKDVQTLVGLAINHAHLAMVIAVYGRTDGERLYHGLPPDMSHWPRQRPVESWKPDYADALDNLTKAEALIADAAKALRKDSPMTPEDTPRMAERTDRQPDQSWLARIRAGLEAHDRGDLNPNADMFAWESVAYLLPFAALLRERDAQIASLTAERDQMAAIIRDTLWMAARYADGRRSYAVGLYNDARVKAEALGCAHEAWPAVDGMDPERPTLTEELATLRAKRDAAQQEIAEQQRDYAILSKMMARETEMLRDEEQENTTLRETLQAAWCELIQHDDQPWVKTLAGQVRVVGLFAFPRPQESQP